jgi:hypothetical protein
MRRPARAVSTAAAPSTITPPASPMSAPSALVDSARAFARAAHGGVGQRRKYTGQPYEEHPRRAAEMVASVTDDPETVAAWLHDVVEDTPVTIEDVERQFGAGVRARVDELTDVSRPQDGNRAAHKALDLAQLTTAPPRADRQACRPDQRLSGHLPAQPALRVRIRCRDGGGARRLGRRRRRADEARPREARQVDATRRRRRRRWPARPCRCACATP